MSYSLTFLITLICRLYNVKNNQKNISHLNKMFIFASKSSLFNSSIYSLKLPQYDTFNFAGNKA